MWRFLKNTELLQKRSLSVIIAFLLAFIVLVFTLIDLQLINGASYTEATNIKRTRTLSVAGMRGRILDANGIPLAQDEVCYNLEFYREYNLNSERQKYTDSIIFAIELIEKYEREIIPTFAITKNENGEYVFSWGDVSEETAAVREKKWRSDFYFADKSGLKKNCEQMYQKMRERYKIPEDMGDEMAFKVLGIWQDSIQLYWSSKAITVLKNIDFELVTAIESYSYELSGFNVVETSIRVYPQGQTACHVVGYMGRITSDNKDYYTQNDYDLDDMVGVSGIEKTMELNLTGTGNGRKGSRVVQVTNGGQILDELSYEAAKTGDNVYLTIDINLQRVVEDALKENIEFMNIRQHELYNKNPQAYKEMENAEGRNGRTTSFASVGAAVVMEAKTGAVLALASQTGYDPNIFSQGISTEDYQAILDDAGKPLFNKAISSSDTPGSIFKLCVSIAGLMENKIRIDEEIIDYGEYTKYANGSKGPMCGYYRDNHITHGSINVVRAINYSCNYFFYEVADRLGIEKIKQWAYNFGLLSKTNIELSGEAIGIVGDQATLYDSTKSIEDQATSIPLLVIRAIGATIDECAKYSDVTLTETQKNDLIASCLALVGKSRSEALKIVRSLLVQDYKMSVSIVDSTTKFHICDYLTEITWTPTNTIITGIGQSITTVTPIAVARYISAIVNGGNVYDAHIVKKITSNTGQLVREVEPSLVRKLNVLPQYLEAVKRGMKDMVSEYEDPYASTAQKYFKDFKYREQMGGKTGTAQVSNINLENNAWFVAFAPYDDPEIVMVVYIPNGYSGSMASQTVKATVEYYLDRKYAVESDVVPAENTTVY